MHSTPDMQETAKFDPAKTVQIPERKRAADDLLGLPRQAILPVQCWIAGGRRPLCSARSCSGL